MEQENILFIDRQDLIRSAFLLPAKKICIHHLSQETFSKVANYSLVIFKDGRTRIVLKNRYGK